jgi:hypothetical protein
VTDAVAVTMVINVDTRMLHVIKAANISDVEELKASLEKNVDPNCLICVRHLPRRSKRLAISQ